MSKVMTESEVEESCLGLLRSLGYVVVYGPDISEVGSTWVGDLISMNALRPFSASDIAVLGGKEPFLPAVWERTRLIGDSRTWSVPWLLDLSAVFFRRDLFQNRRDPGQSGLLRRHLVSKELETLSTPDRSSWNAMVL